VQDKVHYFDYINVPFYEIWTTINPVHIPTSQFSHIQFNIIPSSMRVNNKSARPFRFVAQVSHVFSSPRACYMPRPSVTLVFDHPHIIYVSVEITKLYIVQFIH